MNRKNTKHTKPKLLNLEPWRILIESYLIQELSPHKDKSIIDIGHGHTLPILKSIGFNPHCMDKNKFSDEITYVMSIMDDEKVATVPQYDIVSCCEVLEHTESMEQTARNVMRLVKDGGFAIITVPCYLPHHPGGNFYGDYWRVMPTGLTKLFHNYKVIEKVFPSYEDGLPYGIGAIVKK